MSYVQPTETESYELAKLTANINYWRDKREMSELALAEALGVCLSTYIRWVENPRLIYALVALRMCTILNITYDQLFGVGVRYEITETVKIVKSVRRLAD